MLDQSQSQTGPALGAALTNVHSVEALGQSRNVLGRDARPVVAHADLRLLFAFRGLAVVERNVDALTRSAVFERVLDQIFKHADELVPVARDPQGARSID